MIYSPDAYGFPAGDRPWDGYGIPPEVVAVCPEGQTPRLVAGQWTHEVKDFAAIIEAEQAAQAIQLSLTLAADKLVAAVNEPITITATLNVPIDAQFAIPIEDGNGLVTKIKAVAFAAGVATVTLAFEKSGYYRLTEAGINRKLPPDQQIALVAPFEVTVVE